MAGIQQTQLWVLFMLYCFREALGQYQPVIFYFPDSGRDSTSVQENDAVGKKACDISALRGNGNYTFAVVSQTPASPAFVLDTTSGAFTVPAGLDAETTQTFIFTFSVTDGNTSATSVPLTITVNDVNDNPPFFTNVPYVGTIYSTAANGDRILTVTCDDNDISYFCQFSITARNDTSAFALSQNTGQLTVSTAANLNPPNVYSLTASVFDGIFSGTTVIIITAYAGPDPCTATPCQNGGTCTGSGISYTCACTSGWIGTNCSVDDQCLPSPCLHNGTCSQSGTTYYCSCQIGWLGDHCETDDQCLFSPCLHNGTCSQSGTTYNCSCQIGWLGDHCETEDFCAPGPCQNNGTCQNGARNFTCVCAIGWQGPICDIDDPCIPSPCQNGGTCSISGFNHTCACLAAYSGQNCSDVVTTNTGDADDDPGPNIGGIVGGVIGALSGVVVISIVAFWKHGCFTRIFHSDKADAIRKTKFSTKYINGKEPLKNGTSPVSDETVTDSKPNGHLSPLPWQQNYKKPEFNSKPPLGEITKGSVL